MIREINEDTEVVEWSKSRVERERDKVKIEAKIEIGESEQFIKKRDGEHQNRGMLLDSLTDKSIDRDSPAEAASVQGTTRIRISNRLKIK